MLRAGLTAISDGKMTKEQVDDFLQIVFEYLLLYTENDDTNVVYIDDYRNMHQ